jgi:hypothetical protein
VPSKIGKQVDDKSRNWACPANSINVKREEIRYLTLRAIEASDTGTGWRSEIIGRIITLMAKKLGAKNRDLTEAKHNG